MVISSMEPNVCDEMKKFCGNKQELRIQFAIRPQISEFLMGRLEKAKSGENNINQVSDVKNMIDAIGNIETFCQNDGRRESLTRFASFIMKNVILVRTEIPEETDLNKLFELINIVASQNALRVSTSVLNQVLNEAIAIVQPPTDKGKRLKIYYMTQGATKPPTFVVFVNDKKLFHFSYERYLVNQLRKEFILTGTPIRIIVREKKDKEV